MTLLALPDDSPARGPEVTQAVRWIALGDSFTAGTFPGETTWTRLVLERLSLTTPTELTSLARVGATVGELEREQLPAAIRAKPDLVTIICGGNDVIGRVRPATDRLRAELERVLQRVRAELPETRLLTATYPAIAPGAVRRRTRERIERGLTELNATLREVSARHGVRCVELADHPGRTDRSNYAADGLHPSAVGHRAAAAVLGPAVEELITPDPKEDR